MSFADQLAAFADQASAGPGSETVVFVRADGSEVSASAQVDRNPDVLGGSSDPGRDPWVIHLRQADVSQIQEGVDRVRIGSSTRIVDRVLSSDAKIWSVYLS